jgi:AcrR family transcriptional regulator
LLLALFDEAIRSTAERLEEQLAKESTAEGRLRCFVTEYYRMCLPAPKGRATKNNPTPVLAEFCHQLLTAHHEEASRAFVPLVTLLEKTLKESAEAGAVRPGQENEDVAGIILSTIMFNAAYASTISGTEPRQATRAADEMWEFVAGGILAGARA